MKVNPGELDKRIQIISVSVTEDNDGYVTKTEKTVRICQAKFTRTSGTEVTRANADFGEVKCRFLVRYAVGIKRKMIVRYAGADYEIVYVNDYEDAHEYIELWCQLTTLEG